MSTEQIRTFLMSLTDERADVQRCLNMIIQLQKIVTPSGPAPLIEVISIIKAEKPMLFHLLKNTMKHNTQLQMLFELYIPYEVARERLGYENTSS
jgi:hypothetical protein